MGCTSSKTSNDFTRPGSTRLSLSPKNSQSNKNNRNKEEDEILRLDQEKERELLANKLLTEEKKYLHDRALPMFERRLSVDLLTEDVELQHLQDSIDGAVAIKLQKQARRKNAKISAENSQKWMLFNNADIFDENEMIQLSSFMETIMKRVPDIHEYEIPQNVTNEDNTLKTMSKTLLTKWNVEDDGYMQTKENNGSNRSNGEHRPVLMSSSSIASESSKSQFNSVKSTNSNDTSSPTISAMNSKDEFIIVSRENSVEKLIRLDRLASENMFEAVPPKLKRAENKDEGVYLQNREGMEYDLPTGLVTLGIARSIIDTYKKGGKLSMKAVHKLLRLTYRGLSKLPNITRINLSSKDKLTVVGDIHGQLPDLLHILDESGLPSAHHKYVFNGDFIDRGEQGVEVMCVLMAIYLACPKYVAFNRGNHEDFAICSCYGFQNECQMKYDEITFGMFIEIFNYIPLYAIVNSDVIILHGGLFHALDVRLIELEEIERYDYSLLDMPHGGEMLEPFSRTDSVQFYKQIQRDTLWSDPKDSLGNDYNSRGAGVAFGPDVTKLFLDNNKLKMIIRSHECVRSGFDRPYSEWPEYENILCTIFSASNYGGSGNTSAYIEIVKRDHISVRSIASSMLQRVIDSDLVYSVHYFHVDNTTNMILDGSGYGLEAEDGLDDNADANTEVDFEVLASKSVSTNKNGTPIGNAEGEEIVIVPSPRNNFIEQRTTLSPTSQAVLDAYTAQVNSSPLSIPEQIFRKKMVLLDAFHAADIDKDGILPQATWSDVMQHILKLKIRWVSLLPALIQMNQNQVSQRFAQARASSSFSPSNSGSAQKAWTPPSCIVIDNEGQPAINYFQFLNAFTSPKAFGFEKLDTPEAVQQNLALNNAIVEAIYSHYIRLEQVFQYFDMDANGIISYPEFATRCDIINASLPPEAKIREYDAIFSLMDVKENGEIDINLFFEMFRLADNYSNITEKLYAYQQLARSRSSSAPSTPTISKSSNSNNLVSPANGIVNNNNSSNSNGNNYAIHGSPGFDSPQSSQYSSVPNSPVRDLSAVNGGLVVNSLRATGVNFREIVSVQENENDEDYEDILRKSTTSNNKNSLPLPIVSDNSNNSSSNNASGSGSSGSSIVDRDNKKVISSALIPTGTTSTNGDISPRISSPRSGSFEGMDSILVPSPGKLSRASSSNISIPPAPGVVSSPHSPNHKHRTSSMSYGETVDINGIKISIDTPSGKGSDKDKSHIVSIDI